MNTKILVIEYKSRAALIFGSESFTKLSKLRNCYEPYREQMGIIDMRIEPLIDLEDITGLPTELLLALPDNQL